MLSPRKRRTMSLKKAKRSQKKLKETRISPNLQRFFSSRRQIATSEFHMKGSSFIRTWRHSLCRPQRPNQCSKSMCFALVSDMVTERVSLPITSERLGFKPQSTLPLLERETTSFQLSILETFADASKRWLMTRLRRSTFLLLTEPRNQPKRELSLLSLKTLELVKLKTSKKKKSLTLSFGKISWLSISK